MHKKKFLLALAAAMAAAALSGVSFGQAAAGPFTQRQLEAGRQAYGDDCAQCHNPDLSGSNDAPQLAGDAFMGAWKSRTTQALYNKISKTMPAGAPGSLDETTYTSIEAFILRAMAPHRVRALSRRRPRSASAPSPMARRRRASA